MSDDIDDTIASITAERDVLRLNVQQWVRAEYAAQCRAAQLQAEVDALKAQLAEAREALDTARDALVHCRFRPHEHNPGPDFIVTHCDVIDRALNMASTALGSRPDRAPSSPEAPKESSDG